MTYQLDSDWNVLTFCFFLYLVTHHRHDMPVIDNRPRLDLDQDDNHEQQHPRQDKERSLKHQRQRSSYFQPRKEKKTSWQPIQQVLVN